MIADFLSPFRLDGEVVSLRTFPPRGRTGEALKFDATLAELGDLAPLAERLCDLNKRVGIYFIPNVGGQDDKSIWKHSRNRRAYAAQRLRRRQR